MIKDIDIKQCYNDYDLEKLLKLIATGKAILFAGAGFSVGAVNLVDEKVKLAKGLAEEIDKITNDDSDGDLYTATQYAIESNKSIELIELLKRLFLVKSVEEYHLSILSLPWRRYYTTNYDNVIELGGLKNSKDIKPVTISDSREMLQENICVHVNGYIENLNEDTLNNSFKLSEASYLHQDTLNNSPWVDTFESDIRHASAIIFMGYSLYDYDIEKLLFKYGNYKDKIYFVTRDKPCEEIKKEKKYGKIINIGVQNFSDLISKYDDMFKASQNQEFYYECLKKINLPEEYNEISHDNIREFLIFGKYDDNYISNALLDPTYNRHIIIPSWIEECRNLTIDNRLLHLSADLGVGKTVGLKIFSSILRQEGETVFYLDNSYGDYTGDIQYILNNYSKVYIFIDNAEQNRDVLKYIYEINSPKIICISASRNNISKLFDDALYTKAKLYNIDKMSQSDLGQLISIIENIGASSSLSVSSIKAMIEKNHDNSLPSFLLDFMKSDEIGRVIKGQISKLDNLSNQKYRKTIIALCLLGVLSRKLSFSTIATLTEDSNIRNMELLSNEIFQSFFTSGGDKLEVKSPIFATYILQNYYLDLIKKDTFIRFATIADLNKNNRNLNDKELNYEFELLFKELVKYYTLSRLFTKDNFDVILGYFEKLKTEIFWLEREPHYWLQLAILNIARHRLSVAKDMIEKAKNIARNKSNYNFDFIDTTEARYNIELGLKSSTNVIECFDLFCRADDLFKNTEASNNKYRLINRYIDIYKKINTSISVDNLVVFKQRIKSQLMRIHELEDEGYPGIDKFYLIYNSEGNLKKILHELDK